MYDCGRRGADGSKDRKIVFGLAGGGGGAAVVAAAMGLVWWEWRRRRKRRGTVIGMFVIPLSPLCQSMTSGN